MDSNLQRNYTLAFVAILALAAIIGANITLSSQTRGDVEALGRRIESIERDFDETERTIRSSNATLTGIDRDFTLFEADINSIDHEVDALGEGVTALNAALASVEPVELPPAHDGAVLIGVIVDVVSWCDAVAAPYLTGNIEGFKACIIATSISFCSVAFPDPEDDVLFRNCENPTVVVNSGFIDPDVAPPIWERGVGPDDTQNSA